MALPPKTQQSRTSAVHNSSITSQKPTLSSPLQYRKQQQLTRNTRNQQQQLILQKTREQTQLTNEATALANKVLSNTSQRTRKTQEYLNNYDKQIKNIEKGIILQRQGKNSLARNQYSMAFTNLLQNKNSLYNKAHKTGDTYARRIANINLYTDRKKPVTTKPYYSIKYAGKTYETSNKNWLPPKLIKDKKTITTLNKKLNDGTLTAKEGVKYINLHLKKNIKLPKIQYNLIQKQIQKEPKFISNEILKGLKSDKNGTISSRTNNRYPFMDNIYSANFLQNNKNYLQEIQKPSIKQKLMYTSQMGAIKGNVIQGVSAEIALGGLGIIEGFTTPFIHPVLTGKGTYQSIRHPFIAIRELGQAFEKNPLYIAGQLFGGKKFGDVAIKTVKIIPKNTQIEAMKVPKAYRNEFIRLEKARKAMGDFLPDIKEIKFQNLGDVPAKAGTVIKNFLNEKKQIVTSGSSIMETIMEKRLKRKPADVDMYAPDGTEYNLAKELNKKFKEKNILTQRKKNVIRLLENGKPTAKIAEIHGLKSHAYRNINLAKKWYHTTLGKTKFFTKEGTRIVDPRIQVRRKLQGGFEDISRYSKDIPAFVQSTTDILTQIVKKGNPLQKTRAKIGLKRLEPFEKFLRQEKVSPKKYRPLRKDLSLKELAKEYSQLLPKDKKGQIKISRLEYKYPTTKKQKGITYPLRKKLPSTTYPKTKKTPSTTYPTTKKTPSTPYKTHKPIITTYPPTTTTEIIYPPYKKPPNTTYPPTTTTEIIYPPYKKPPKPTYPIIPKYPPNKPPKKKKTRLNSAHKDKPMVQSYRPNLFTEKGKKLKGKHFKNPKNAIDNAMFYTDQSKYNRFKITKDKTNPANISKSKPYNQKHKFRQKGNTYIEKKYYRFDKKGEQKGGNFNLFPYVFGK